MVTVNIDSAEIFKEFKGLVSDNYSVPLSIFTMEGYSPDNLYVIDAEVLPKIDFLNDNFLNEYGIFVNNTPAESLRRRNILIINEEDVKSPEAFSECIDRSVRANKTFKFTDCYFNFDVDFTLYNVMNYAPSEILMRFKEVRFLNTKYKTEITRVNDLESSILNRYVQEDITQLFLDVRNSKGVSDNVLLFRKLCNEVLRRNKGNTIFFIDFSNPNIAANRYLEDCFLWVAVYCSIKWGVKFWMPEGAHLKYTKAIKDVFSREHLLLEDYIENIIKFPFFTVSTRFAVPFLSILNLKELATPNYDVKLRVISIPIDVENFALLKTSVEGPTTLYLKDINIVPIRKLAKLDSINIKDSYFEKFSAMFKKFCKVCVSEVTDLSLTKLNFRNILCYRYNDKVYIAYVSDIEGKLPFNILSLCKDGSPYRKDININDLGVLNDICAVNDINGYVSKIVNHNKGYSNTNRYHFVKSNLEGIAERFNYVNAEVRVDEKSKLSIVDSGVWDSNCEVMIGMLGKFEEYMNKSEIIDSHYFGFFGCIHPYQYSDTKKVLEIDITPEFWKGE